MCRCGTPNRRWSTCTSQAGRHLLGATARVRRLGIGSKSISETVRTNASRSTAPTQSRGRYRPRQPTATSHRFASSTSTASCGAARASLDRSESKRAFEFAERRDCPSDEFVVGHRRTLRYQRVEPFAAEFVAECPHVKCRATGRQRHVAQELKHSVEHRADDDRGDLTMTEERKDLDREAECAIEFGITSPLVQELDPLPKPFDGNAPFA